MKNKNLKFSSTGLSFLILCVVLFTSAIVCVKASNFPIPEADITYDSDNNWEETLEISENKTVKISDIYHSNQETGYVGPAIKISGDATVNLVFEGENVLSGKGSTSVASAGIEVVEGSTVNIYGVDGSSLTVTGGENSAGIGGAGYGSPGIDNAKAGNVVIYSGNITAIGGNKGAGIGSGNHSSASNIEIKGGNIIALGSGSGAGIGSGYGTSGGAARNGDGQLTGAGVGFYNGGNITISGGTVKAAAYHMNFDNFDPYNTETLYGEGYSDTFAAGIGGGYGASSGNIIIEGDADVVAIGSCGGAGIGSGRGTSKAANYDSTSFDVNVTIRGNSKVVAMATDDKRASVVGDDGGAAIGLGRGCTLEGEPKGTIVIEGNANVYAVAPDHAQAIGGSCVVGKFTKDEEGNIIRPAAAHIKSILIGEDTIIMVTGDNYRPGIDKESRDDLVVLNVGEDYFENRGDFFTEDKFPLKIEAVNADNNEVKSTFSIKNPEDLSFVVHLPNTSKYNFVISDYRGESNEKIFISNSVEENTAQFLSDPAGIKEYDSIGLTSRLDRSEIVDSEYGELNVKIEASEGIFEYGSDFFCEVITDEATINELNSNLDKKYVDNLKRILYFDIGAKDRNGERYTQLTGGKVKIYIELPKGWDKDEVLMLFVNSLGNEDFSGSQKLETIDGITYLSFETDHFSSYALFESVKRNQNQDDPKEENSGESGSEDSQPTEYFLTGDNAYFRCMVWSMVLIASLVGIAIFKKPRGKRFRR